jgi:hypothetical protein
VGDSPQGGQGTIVAGAAPPANSSPPVISGTAQERQILTTSNGTWNGAPPFTYSYQWRDCDTSGSNCLNIAGATGSTYQPGHSDVGSTLRAVVAASNPAGSASATSAQTAAVAAAPPLTLVFNTNLHQTGPGVTDFTIGDVARAASDIAPGAILRFSVPWEGVQPYCFDSLGNKVWNSPPSNNRSTCVTPGPYDWTWNNLESDLDSIASYLQSGQLRLLPVVIEAPTWAWGFGDVPDPSSDPGTGYNAHYPDMPPGGDSTALGWWSRFNAALVSWLEGRYGRSSLAGLEVWNEEDFFPISWSLEPNDQSAMALRYSQVLCSAYTGVRESDLSLPVFFGGINPSPTNGTSSNPVPYLQDAYTSPAANIRNCMTAISIHPYNTVNGGPWLAPNTQGSPFATGASKVSQVASGQNDAGRPIWITEFGYPISNPPTQQQQADWDSEAYNLAPTLPNVQTMGIHTLFDQPGGFQICAGPRSPLPAANELKQAVSKKPTATASC